MINPVTRPLFQWVVLIPNVVSVIYFGLVASPIYESDAQLLVRSSRKQAVEMTQMLAGGGAGSNLEGGYILQGYVESWEAYHTLDHQQRLGPAFAQADPVSRFGGLGSFFRTSDIALWQYFKSMASAAVEEKSGVVDIRVRAYTAADAHRLTSALLANAVARMNVMNSDEEHDAVGVAVSRKVQVEQALAQDEAQIAAYRAREGVFDPDARYAADLQVTGGLALQEAQIAAQQSAGQQAMSDNPNVTALKASAAAVRDRISQARADGPVLAKKASVYNQLITRRDNDAALLKSVSLAVQEAELKATEGRYYLSVISAPSAPVAPQLPHRLEWIGGVFAVSLLLWALLR